MRTRRLILGGEGDGKLNLPNCLLNFIRRTVRLSSRSVDTVSLLKEIAGCSVLSTIIRIAPGEAAIRRRANHSAADVRLSASR